MSDSEGKGKTPVTRNQLEDYEERKKKWYLDVRNTPCAREALIHGILGGMIVGALYFAKTSIVIKACDWAVVGFGVLSITSWEVCRLYKAKQRSDVKKAVQVLNQLNGAKASPQPPGSESLTSQSSQSNSEGNSKTSPSS